MTSVYALLQTHLTAKVAHVLDPETDPAIAAGVQRALLLRVDRGRHAEVDKLPSLRGALPHADATELMGVDERGRLRVLWEFRLPALPQAAAAKNVLPILLGAPPPRPALWEPPVGDVRPLAPRRAGDFLGRDDASTLYVVLDLRNRPVPATYARDRGQAEPATAYAVVRAELDATLEQARAHRANPVAVAQLQGVLEILDLCSIG